MKQKAAKSLEQAKRAGNSSQGRTASPALSTIKATQLDRVHQKTLFLLKIHQSIHPIHLPTGQ